MRKIVISFIGMHEYVWEGINLFYGFVYEFLGKTYRGDTFSPVIFSNFLQRAKYKQNASNISNFLLAIRGTLRDPFT